MSSDLALSIRGLSKSYTIRPGSVRPTTLGEALSSRLRHPLHRTRRQPFVALRDVSFDLPCGEVLGVIGSNGAGKSTLLKILSRITTPTAGEARVYGRVGSLLEVGTGFHPELTGRENIYMNGAILGMRSAEVTRRFDEIVEFAGVQQFIETPVKRYSSGMYVRLAFAVAAHLDTEILLIDEVLAVGDGAFQRKSLGKMGDAAKSGRTVIVVSHNVAVVSKLATTCVVLEQGALVFQGQPGAAIEQHMSRMIGATAAGSFADAERWHITNPQPAARFVAGWLDSTVGLYDVGEVPRIGLTIDRLAPKVSVCLRVTVHRVSGEAVGTAFSIPLEWPEGTGLTDYSVELTDVSLSPGRYSFELDLRDAGARIYSPPHDCVLQVLPFEVAPTEMGNAVEQWPPSWGSVSWKHVVVSLDLARTRDVPDPTEAGRANRASPRR